MTCFNTARRHRENSGVSMKTVSHLEILKAYKGRISITFFVLVLEHLLLLLEPLVIGIAINGLAARDWNGVYFFLGLETLIILVGVARRLYDTRAYGDIYKNIGQDISATAIENHDDLSPAIKRADLLQEVVGFFENELPMALGSTIAILGALIMLFVLAPPVGAVALFSAIVIALIFVLSRTRIRKLNTLVNDELEARARLFMARERQPLFAHFATLVRHQISLSDLEARNFGLSYLFVVLLIAFSLYQSVAVAQAPIGDVFAVLTYAAQFAEGVIILPMMYQQYVRTSEITNRITDGLQSET